MESSPIIRGLSGTLGRNSFSAARRGLGHREGNEFRKVIATADGDNDELTTVGHIGHRDASRPSG